MKKLLFLSLLFPVIIQAQITTKVANIVVYYPDKGSFVGVDPKGDSIFKLEIFQPFVDSNRVAYLVGQANSKDISTLKNQHTQDSVAIAAINVQIASLKNQHLQDSTAIAAAQIQIAALQKSIDSIKNNWPSGGGGIPIPAPNYINVPAYTIQSTDNGKILYVSMKCTITIPPLTAGIKCWVVRKTPSGTGGTITFTGPSVAIKKRSSFTPLAGSEYMVEIDYESTAIVGIR